MQGDYQRQPSHKGLCFFLSQSLIYFLVSWRLFVFLEGSTRRGVAMCCSAFEVPLATRGMCCSMLQCVAACCSVLQRVVVSQQAKKRSTPCHKRPAGKTQLCAPCLWHYAASLLLFSVVDSSFFAVIGCNVVQQR